ncbi:MAG: AAA family ATPase [Thermonemataceae bacterium]|nr:AAA family ATPase [Thermonemataceae bacterium]
MKDKEFNQEKSKISIFDYEIHQYSQIKESEPTIYIRDALFAAKGELSFISGKAKSGKTSIAVVTIANCLVENPEFDNLHINSVYCENQPIIYIDTEQSQSSSKKIIDRISKLLNRPEQPENFKIFNLRSLSIDDRKEFVKQMFETIKNPHLVFVDGLGDFVKSANDEKEANEILQLFAYYAEKYHTSIILFLHETHTNEKMRGHLGSEAERKCFATISVSKDRNEQTHSIKAKLFRDSKDFEEIGFKYNEELKAMESIKDSEYKKTKRDEKNEFLYLEKILFPNEKINNTELINRLTKYTNLKPRTCQDKIQKMVKLGLIEKEEKHKNEVYYYLPNSAL